MKMLGGHAVARALKLEGVEHVFGIIDGTYFGFYSSLGKEGIELISPRHETCAAHMAGAYARTSGKLGVCMASNGPGVANLLPGIAVENTEGNRVLCITSSRRPDIIYPDRGGAYQVFDQVGVIGKMAKFSEAVKSPNRLMEIVRKALRACYTGRPGVVHIDIPENFMNGEFEFSEGDFWQPSQYRKVHGLYPDPALVKKTAELLVKANFPIIHAGSGIMHANAYEELQMVAEALSMPVTTSWGARGVLSENHYLAIPMIHVDVNNDVRNEADYVLCLGSRLGETDWWGKPPYWANRGEQKFIQVDIDEECLGRNRPVELAIQADLKLFLKALADEIKSSKPNFNDQDRKNKASSFRADCEKSRQKLNEQLQKNENGPMYSAWVANICQKMFKDDAIGVFDGGNACIWGQFFFEMRRPGMGISTPKMGHLGAGTAQALGIQVAFPDRRVFCITGDGAMGFHPQEVETAVRNGLPIIYIVLCDRQWGMVKMNQSFQLRPIKTLIKKKLDPGENINADLGEIEFDKMAQSMGAFGFRADTPEKLEHALKMAIESEGCAVIHVDVDPVKHMWAPALMHFKKMHEEPKGK